MHMKGDKMPFSVLTRDIRSRSWPTGLGEEARDGSTQIRVAFVQSHAYDVRDSTLLAVDGFGGPTLPERICLIVLQSSCFVSSDKKAIRNEEWDQGSRIKARDLRYRASYRKSKEAVLCRFTPGFQIFTRFVDSCSRC